MSRETGVRDRLGDRGRLLILCGVMVVMIGVVCAVAPSTQENDPRPTVTNVGPHGAKAAYLTLEALGVKTSEWGHPLSELNADLSDAEVARTTLILAEPQYDATQERDLAAAVNRFLERGGRVLTTGGAGARLLPDGEVSAAGMLASGACETTPEGPGELARAGRVEMVNAAQWSKDGAKYVVEQRCGRDAVVVRYVVGKGEAVWWSSSAPMENAGLKKDASLKLLLASVGVGPGLAQDAGRDVVFGESLHGAVRSIWDAAKGLPLKWLALQAALLFALLVVSFSRRRGPVRAPVRLPRSSPVEFAVSMGDLYEKAAASSAATEAAKRRLLRVLTREAGVAQGTIEEGPEAIAEALRARLGGDWSLMSEHLEEAKRAQHEVIAMRSALALVRALSEDAKRVRASLVPAVNSG
ncbi:MAG TPA: DUF4350 domain-containing protein [Acidobacteriaceae bacterium]|nr:DUF4350 domain-containing protein [Acidobacteriaceae bacterium]